MLLLILFAFLSGIVTIFAPCIWPILPIILSAGVSGGEKKPLGVVAGLMVSFTVFTLALSYILKVVPIDPNTLRLFAVAVITFLGLVLIVPALGRRLEAFVRRLTSRGGFMRGGSGFKGGFITGFALGIVWSPCAGPILATVATLAATQTLNLSIVLVTLAFVLGVGLPLFVLALLGQRILTRTRSLSPYTARIQQVFGVVMILAALAIYTGYDQTLQLRFANFCSANGITFLDRIQNNTAVTEALDTLRNPEKKNAVFPEKSNAPSGTLPVLGTAPEFVGITNWLNVDKPITLASLRGKVVLIDFWTYSCINCIRTLPSVTRWYDTYKDEGFVVIGVHTPEFEFEKKTSNVADAIERYKIHYPVAQDNAFGTWQAYENRYWPAHYLIDAEGRVREVHFGEGNYQETEEAIRSLLKESGQTLEESPITVMNDTEGRQSGLTPETYLGSDRMERFLSPEKVGREEARYSLPSRLTSNNFAFDGLWRIEPERAVAGAASALELQFKAGKVFLVMAPAEVGKVARAKVYIDGQVAGSGTAGADVDATGMLSVDSDRLYELVHFSDSSASSGHRLRIEFETPGMSAYAFTFGN
ncbi:MAG: cytochrome c biogenesis protein DipZ [Undibacterium sp.]